MMNAAALLALFRKHRPAPNGRRTVCGCCRKPFPCGWFRFFLSEINRAEPPAASREAA